MCLSWIYLLANVLHLSVASTCTGNCTGNPGAVSTEQRAVPTLPGGCNLPERPEHGSYDSPMCYPDSQHPGCLNTPGTAVPPRWLLRYTCDDTYDLTTTGSEYSVCDHGIWLHRIDCKRLCPPLQQTWSVDVECKLGDRQVPCDRPVKAKTSATVRCKRDFTGPEASSLHCQESGQWSHRLFNCTPASAATNSLLTLGCRLPEHPDHGYYTSAQCRPQDTKSACRGGHGVPVPHNWLLKYTCHQGFVLSSSSQFSVCDNGVWQNPLHCLPVPDLSANVTNSIRSSRRKRQASCSNKQYTCDNDQCIPTPSLCNGKRDCNDGSDETSAVCRFNRCASRTFRCAYGACVDGKLKCDGKPDCADGSDENGCPSSSGGVAECTFGKLQCDNGQCVDLSVICDGSRDCGDGSDETETLCKLISCPSTRFQCKYGACLEKSVRCDGHKDCPDGSDEHPAICDPAAAGPATHPLPLGTHRPMPVAASNGDCKLPEHPVHGKYVSAHCIPGDSQPQCQDRPGTPVPPTWLIRYVCNDGYSLSSGDYAFAVCNNGAWENLLDCIKTCPPLVSLSLDIKCKYDGQEVSCDRPMKPGTKATTECKQHYQKVYNPHSTLTCKETGDWNYDLAFCLPECGVSINAEALIKDGAPTQQGDFPWLTALYLKTADGVWDQQCGGTLISPHIVLTAAHCITDEFAVPRKPEDIKVGLGKYYRDFNKNEKFSKIVDVRKVLYHPYYTGRIRFYAFDIGLLDLVQSVQVTAYIMPACVDWRPPVPIIIKPGDVGTVAGWGTTENQTSSQTILSTQLAYVEPNTCSNQLGLRNRGYLTTDKFCAEIHSGGSVARGDSGGGLTFLKDGLHYVYGVVSTRIVDVLRISLFTDITNAQHLQWLDSSRTTLDESHDET